MGTAETETPAHEDYLTVERFRELRNALPPFPTDTGDSVAFLHERDGKLTISYGVKFDSKGAGTNSYRIGVVTREGKRYYVHYDHVARIES